eukprot:1151119-Pelagomonas_calceolata.AAC.1
MRQAIQCWSACRKAYPATPMPLLGPLWLGRLGSSALYVATYPRTSAHVVAAATAVGDATPRILRPDA